MTITRTKIYYNFILLPILFIIFTSCTDNTRVIHIIGDSTMAEYDVRTTQTRGWGQYLHYFFNNEIIIANYARGGRSSRSFYSEGLWNKVLDSINNNDIVIIQFAHNDEKEFGKDGADGRGTAPWTTYKDYLCKYIEETQQKGAIPVLAGPIVRRYFSANDSISLRGRHNLSTSETDTTLNYVAVMQYVAKKYGITYIDMTQATRQTCESYGPDASKHLLYVDTDNTHLKAGGAAAYAWQAANLLQEKIICKKKIVSNPGIILNPTQVNFGNVLIGDEQWCCIDLINTSNFTDTLPSFEPKQITVNAPRGITLAKAIDGPRSQKITVRTPNEQRFYVFFAPQTKQNIEVQLIVDTPNGKAQVSLSGAGTELNNITKTWVEADSKSQLKSSGKEISLHYSALKGLKYEKEYLTTTNNFWPQDIDESGLRYVELILEATSKPISLRSLSITTAGETCYRVAYAYGKDFYPRSVVGECLKESETPTTQTFDWRFTLDKRQRIHLRIYPWCSTANDNAKFNIINIRVDGIITQ